MSDLLTRSSFSLLLLIISFVSLILFPTVLSAENILRLPSDGDKSVCADPVSQGSCPIKCFRADPVCGVDNVTYWCGCADALCSGARVAKLGICDVENGGNGSVSGQALQLVQMVWLILLGFFVLLGLL